MKFSMRLLVTLAVLAVTILSISSPSRAQEPLPPQTEAAVPGAEPQSPNEPSASKKVFLPLIRKPCQPANIVLNGSFEAGPANWTDTDAAQINIFQSSIVYDGSWVSGLGDMNRYNAALYQALNIPAGYTALKIEFYGRVYSTDLTSGLWDVLYASLQPAGSVTNPETIVASNASPRQVWQKYTLIYNSIPNPGQQKRVYFHVTTDASLTSVFRIDAVEVYAQCTPFAQAAAGSSDPVLLIDDAPAGPMAEPLASPDEAKAGLSDAGVPESESIASEAP